MSARPIDRVYAAGPSTPTEQVDRRRDVLPGDPYATDPFISYSEDWFRRVGFDGHPHRGFIDAMSDFRRGAFGKIPS